MKHIGNLILSLLVLALSIYLLAFQGAPDSKLSIQIIDKETGIRIPARVRLSNVKGSITVLPEQAIAVMYGRDDKAEGYAFQPDSSFYVDGGFNINLPAGDYQLNISKGFEYLSQSLNISLKSGKSESRTILLERWINMPEHGWYSADDHIHIRRSPRENPLILKWIEAEDVHVGALLQMGDFWTTYFAQYAFGKPGVYKIHKNMLTSGQEDPRTHEIGHTILLTADSAVRYKQSYYEYDKVFDHVHDLGGLTGYAHQGMSFHGYRGMTMDVLQGKVDFLELLQFCVPGGPLHLEHYYHFLDLGYKLTATAGSDFPWCGKGSGWSAQIGNARFYTYVGDSLTFSGWQTSLKRGHTFVTSGPMLELTVNGKLPGEELHVNKGEKINMKAVGLGQKDQVPLDYLEIVSHGKVIAKATADQAGQSSEKISIVIEIPVEKGQWIAARCKAGPSQWAHTTPVYVTINNGGFINPETAPHYLDLSEQYLEEIEKEIATRNDRVDYNAWRYREELEHRISDTRKILSSLRAKIQ